MYASTYTSLCIHHGSWYIIQMHLCVSKCVSPLMKSSTSLSTLGKYALAVYPFTLHSVFARPPSCISVVYLTSVSSHVNAACVCVTDGLCVCFHRAPAFPACTQHAHLCDSGSVSPSAQSWFLGAAQFLALSASLVTGLAACIFPLKERSLGPLCRLKSCNL